MATFHADWSGKLRRMGHKCEKTLAPKIVLGDDLDFGTYAV